MQKFAREWKGLGIEEGVVHKLIQLRKKSVTLRIFVPTVVGDAFFVYTRAHRLPLKDKKIDSLFISDLRRFQFHFDFPSKI